MIALQLIEVKRLGNNSFADESGVAVNTDRNRFGRILLRHTRLAAILLCGPREAFDNRINEFKVTRVVGQS
jgi:hypothetical protein